MLSDIYTQLFNAYGPQGWWPLLDHGGSSPSKTGSRRGYHPGQYKKRTRKQRFEICIGAILTQNTNWTNVERALGNLHKAEMIDAFKICTARPAMIEKHIRPSGYFRQKTRKLKEFASFYLKLNGQTPSRDQLLAIWGIGPETADSILLYAYDIPTFVIDGYTKRILSHLGVIREGTPYEDVQTLFHTRVKKDVRAYQEYHALLVEHAKRHYSRKPYGKTDTLLNQIKPRP